MNIGMKRATQLLVGVELNSSSAAAAASKRQDSAFASARWMQLSASSVPEHGLWAVFAPLYRVRGLSDFFCVSYSSLLTLLALSAAAAPFSVGSWAASASKSQASVEGFSSSA